LHGITIIVLWLFPISEVALALRKRATRSGATSLDHGSVQALWITFGLAIAGADLLAYRHMLPLGLGRTLDEALVVGCMGSGMILCWIAILVGLGCVRPTGTTGPRIGSYPAPRTALLLIDLQEDDTGPRAKQRYRDADRILAATNGLLAKAGTDGDLVVFIENVETGALVHLLTGGLNAPGAPGTDLDRRLLPPSGARIFTKEAPDAFSNREFDTYLREDRVDLLGEAGVQFGDHRAQGRALRDIHEALVDQGLLHVHDPQAHGDHQILAPRVAFGQEASARESDISRPLLSGV
jgi:hypothetical protein